MNFTASIIRGSVIDRTWRDHHRLSGDVAGVRFHLVGSFAGGTYQAREVTSDRVAIMRHNASVRLEARGDVAAPVEAEREPEPAAEETADEAAPVSLSQRRQRKGT